MEADCTLAELPQVKDFVYWGYRIHCQGPGWVHLYRVCLFDPAVSEFQVLLDDTIVFDHEPTNGYDHPAGLFSVIVDRACLPDFPTHCKQFVDGRFLNQVSRIVPPIPHQIWLESLGIDRMFYKEF